MPVFIWLLVFNPSPSSPAPTSAHCELLRSTEVRAQVLRIPPSPVEWECLCRGCCEPYDDGDAVGGHALPWGRAGASTPSAHQVHTPYDYPKQGGLVALIASAAMMRLLSWFLDVPGGIITSPQNTPCEAHLPERQSQRAAGWHGDGHAHLRALRLGRCLRPVPSHALPCSWPGPASSLPAPVSQRGRV